MPAGKEAVTSRELDGKLYAGHETFEWLLAVISYIMAAEVGPEAAAHACAVAALAAHSCWQAWQAAGSLQRTPSASQFAATAKSSVQTPVMLVCCAEKPQEG